MKIDKEKMKMAMAKKCWNFKDLGKAANLSYATIRRASTETNVKPKTIGLIAKTLDLTVEQLIEK